MFALSVTSTLPKQFPFFHHKICSPKVLFLENGTPSFLYSYEDIQSNKQTRKENILRTNSYTKNDIELVHQFWKSSECCHMKVFCIICFWHGTMSTMPKTNDKKGLRSSHFYQNQPRILFSKEQVVQSVLDSNIHK